MPSDDTTPRDGIPDMDALGIYVSHDLSTHHPMIKVCPERVIDACRSWNKKIDGALEFAERYPALLYAVIIHELAHSLMDGQRCGTWSWTKYVRWLEDNAPSSHADEWTNTPVPDRDCEVWIQKRISAKPECRLKSNSIESWSKANSISVKPLREQREVVEESLANAFVLRQAFGERHLAALRVFIDAQSAPYKAGLRWLGNIGELLSTASSWSCFKTDDIGIGDRKWVAVQPSRREGLDGLARRLLTPGEAIASFDFQRGV